MNHKPHLLPADTSKKSHSLDIIPDNIRKRRSISVKEKLDILSMIDSGCKVTEVARIFGISSSTASTILKERHKIKLLSDHYNIDPDRKRMRLGIYRDVDEAVHMWFKQERMKNQTVSGPQLQQKAREFALQLGHQNFEGSSGWLFRFRERHGLCGKNKRDMDDLNDCLPGVGMTDDEIVNSVSQNAAHAFSFDKEKNSSKLDVPQKYLVPKIELIDSEPNTEPSECQDENFDDCKVIVPCNVNENAMDYNNCGPSVVYNNSNDNENAIDYKNFEQTLYHNSRDNENATAYKNCVPTVMYNSNEYSEYSNTETSHMYNNTPYEYIDSGMELNSSAMNLRSAIALADKLKSFIKQHSAPENILKSMDIVNHYLETDLREQFKQRKITDFFK